MINCGGGYFRHQHRQAKATLPLLRGTDFRHPLILLSLILGSNRRLRFSAFSPVDRDKKSDELRFSGVPLRYAQEAFDVLAGPFEVAYFGRGVVCGSPGAGRASVDLIADLNQMIAASVGAFGDHPLISRFAQIRDNAVPLQDNACLVIGLSERRSYSEEQSRAEGQGQNPSGFHGFLSSATFILHYMTGRVCLCRVYFTNLQAQRANFRPKTGQRNPKGGQFRRISTTHGGSRLLSGNGRRATDAGGEPQDTLLRPKMEHGENDREQGRPTSRITPSPRRTMKYEVLGHTKSVVSGDTGWRPTLPMHRSERPPKTGRVGRRYGRCGRLCDSVRQGRGTEAEEGDQETGETRGQEGG